MEVQVKDLIIHRNKMVKKIHKKSLPSDRSAAELEILANICTHCVGESITELRVYYHTVISYYSHVQIMHH